ncbi:Uncharacterised protein [uncultured Avibacterium sp.]|uniref:Uncharacterized protein n=1 Tax=uncultured Avibacterium sp. TaxID=1936169 RepID=A0A486XD04_9PAST|nr:Uncharacterised protein [uncultured Avibacterium sp.]
MKQKFEAPIYGGQFGVIYNSPPPKNDDKIPDNHPWKVICPQCEHTTLRFNEYCNNGQCTFGIRAHFDNQEWMEQEKRRQAFLQKQSQRLVIFTILVFVISLLGLFLGNQHPIGYLLFLVAGFLTLAFNNAGQKIDKEIKEINIKE